MKRTSKGPPICPGTTHGGCRPCGFSLLEMKMVVTMILIVLSIATPIYQTCATRAREAVLRDHLFTLRALIDPSTDGPRSLAAGGVGRERLSVS
jgi:prepilin-type N-terminal cleavage/methylation domain-containing protein